MGVDFRWPYLLLLIPALAAGALLLWRRTRARRAAALALRVGVIALLALALADTSFRYGIARQSTIFVVDLSASSQEGKETAEQFIHQALAYRGAGDSFAVVTVGEQAMVDLPLMERSLRAPIMTEPGPHRSALADGLRLAGALFPADARKRIVLFSDGLENSGDAEAEARALAKKGVRVDVVPIASRIGPDVAVESLVVPPVLYEGERAAATVLLHSTMNAEATVRLYAGRTLAAETTLTVKEGLNQVAFNVKAPGPGIYTYKAVVEVEGDTVSQNDSAAAVSRVGGRPTLLLVERDPVDGDGLAALLEASGIIVQRVNPARVPTTAPELRAYAAVLLVGVPAYELSEAQMLAIESFVRDAGGGLAMVGGEESFGLGGYFNTPIERALPVYMNLKGRGEIPSVGLVSVIDRSGSMLPGGKLELAKEATALAAELLTPRDMIGVITFDTAAAWAVPLQQNEGKNRILGDIASIVVGGGTNIFPGLQMAYEALAVAPVKVKHIILLTDGRSAFGGAYEQLALRMRAEGITLTTVAIGSDSDQVLLTNLAVWGAGRYYYTETAESVPKIFTKETMMVTRVFAVDRRFYPVAAAASPVIQGLDSIPALRGYVATTAKEAAEVALAAPGGDKDPILAHWQYGLGRAAAWTPDMKGRWAAEWLGTPQAQQVWSSLVSWLLPPQEAEDLNVKTAAEPGQITLTVETPDRTNQTFPTRLILTDPQSNSSTQAMAPVAPGRYEVTLPVEEPGAYLLTVEQERDGGVVRVGGGAVVPYSPEYRHVSVDGMRLLQALTAATGGALLTDPAAAFGGDLPLALGRMALSPWLLALAVLLWLADVAVRRMAPGRWRFARAPVPAGVPRSEGAPGTAPVEPGNAAVKSAASAPDSGATPPPAGDLSDQLLAAVRKKPSHGG